MKQISSKQALELIKANKVIVLDVRTPEENKEKRIKNSLLIPLQELQARLNEIPKDKPILVYCRSGNRSVFASQILEGAGFKEILNLEEGIIDCPDECID